MTQEDESGQTAPEEDSLQPSEEQVRALKERTAKARAALAAARESGKGKAGLKASTLATRRDIEEKQAQLTMKELEVMRGELTARQAELDAQEAEIATRLQRAREKIEALRARKCTVVKETPAWEAADPHMKAHVQHAMHEAARKASPEMMVRAMYGDW